VSVVPEPVIPNGPAEGQADESAPSEAPAVAAEDVNGPAENAPPADVPVDPVADEADTATEGPTDEPAVDEPDALTEDTDRPATTGTDPTGTDPTETGSTPPEPCADEGSEAEVPSGESPDPGNPDPGNSDPESPAPESPEQSDTPRGAIPRPGPPPLPGAAPKGESRGVLVGRVVDVVVSAVQPDEVEVRLIDGRTGVIPRSEFTAAVAVGDTIPAALLARDDPRGRVVLSHAWARKQRAWESVEAAHADGAAVVGRALKVVKGGVVVDVGLRGFLPMSLISEGGDVTAEALVGTDVEALVVEVDRAKDRIVLSRRDLIRRRRRKTEKEAFASLQPGARVAGRVVAVADYGALVEVGGVRGLVHRSELSWQRFESPTDVVSVGDDVEVEVLEVHRSRRRVGLSLRRTAPDPLADIELGSIHDGTVVRVVDYGAFIQLAGSGAEGLVHLTELTDVPGFRPDQLVAPGEDIVVKVMAVDLDRRRLALSVRRVLVDD
jgi:small subunit ribosomal protein S1